MKNFNKGSKINQFSKRLFATKTHQLPPFNYTPPKYEGPSFDQVKEMRKKHIPSAIFSYYKNPIMITDGKMQYLFDHTGRRYLDFFAGIVTVSVGHCHPEIVKAGTEQMQKVMHTTTIYYNNQIAEFAKELAAKLPDPIDVIYFVNSGSEANDLAVMLARLATGNDLILAPRNAYHGMSQGSMGLTALNTWRYPVTQSGGILHVLNPDTYRGPFKKSDPEASNKYAWDVKNVIEHCTPGRVAGWIAEPIQGVGGTVVLPKGYLKNVYSTIRQYGGVCIADEVQTGFGRTGTHFWGFQQHDVMPDIVTMAKGIGNGIPLAAVATTQEIANKLAQKIHFNTYGGNPISSAIGRAVLRVIEKENIQQNALEMGKRLKEGLLDLQKKYPIIGDVRGEGLMLGMELVKDGKTLAPATEEVLKIFERSKDLGLLIGKGGLYGNVFRIKPPMCINKEDVDFALGVLDTAFSEL